MKKDLINKAYTLGQNAFHNNLKSTPVHDAELMNLISNARSQIGNEIGSSTPLFKAWIKGWHNENLKVKFT